MNKKDVLKFYKNKRVLITGNTGFKGTWMTKVLLMAGANIVGYSLDNPSNPSLYELAGIGNSITTIYGDVRDFDKLSDVFKKFQPEIVFHLAAQPIVRESYIHPRETYETNVMGTVNVCECVRLNKSVCSFVNVTTDKVYKNNEWCWGYRECDMLDGYDPYSNSKSCSELVTHAYINSFFGVNKEYAMVPVSTVRAGNVIGGGDFAKDRIIPDCVRAVLNKNDLVIRNPHSIRPYQHVLEPIILYLIIAYEQLNDYQKAGFYNVGPDDSDCIDTECLVSTFKKFYGDNFKYIVEDKNQYDFHEANYLRLDNSLVKKVFNWRPTWHIEEAVEHTVDWIKEWCRDSSIKNVNQVMEKQIYDFLEL